MTYPPGKTVVLVVEDEALVRMDAVDMMEEFGFDVLEACNSDEAIRLLEDRLDVSVVFTDIDMPGPMNGLKLAQAVRGRWPPIKIIVTSGQFKIVEGDLPNGGAFCRNPIRAVNSTVSSLRLRDVRKRSVSKRRALMRAAHSVVPSLSIPETSRANYSKFARHRCRQPGIPLCTIPAPEISEPKTIRKIIHLPGSLAGRAELH